MSTPINQLPTNKPSSASLPDDPEVLNVLQEMEQEVKTAARANSVPMPPPPPSMPMMMMPPPQYTVKKTASTNKWINHEIMQRAAIIGVIALITFYPKTMEYVYSIPKLAFLEQFDITVRAAMLAVVVYLASIQFEI